MMVTGIRNYHFIRQIVWGDCQAASRNIIFYKSVTTITCRSVSLYYISKTNIGMKKTILLALICIAAISCDKKEDSTPQPDPSPINLSYQKATTVRTSGSDLKVELKEVSDSRCPINADCISAGSAKLVLAVSDASNQVNVNFEFKPAAKNEQVFRLGSTDYILTVSEVLPYPQIAVTPKLEDYNIAVSIEKK